IIFMDIQMPVLTGYEAGRCIRSLDRPDAKQVWIVAMTANAFVEDVRLSKEAGMNEHVSKPVDLERLQDVLGRRFIRGNE
ncbi:MAG: response regulator, partial [Oscillospiraceae bacterium]|nr:response regulator [Oscillospiraceae bacterium]